MHVNVYGDVFMMVLYSYFGARVLAPLCVRDCVKHLRGHLFEFLHQRVAETQTRHSLPCAGAIGDLNGYLSVYSSEKLPEKICVTICLHVYNIKLSLCSGAHNREK